MKKTKKSTGLKTGKQTNHGLTSENQTTGLKRSVESDFLSMTPNEVLSKYGIDPFIEVMKTVEPEWTIIPNEEKTGFQVFMNDTTPLEIETVNITQDKFSEYRKCQDLGKFNMLDYSNWESYTTLTECEWYQIISNFDNYLYEFEGKRV